MIKKLLLPFIALSITLNQSHADTLSVDVIKDKISGSLAGILIGVGWGLPTEWKARNQILHDTLVPVWTDNMINQFRDDDAYLDIPWLDARHYHGVTPTWAQLEEHFSKFDVPWRYGSNQKAAANIAAGIHAPECGFYLNKIPGPNGQSEVYEDLDYQIGSDMSGILCPGMPNAAADIAWKDGHVMEHGNGVYGGVFQAIAISSAYLTNDPVKIIESVLTALPDGTRYKAAINYLLTYYKNTNSTNWRQAHAYMLTYLTTEKIGGIDAVREGVWISVGLLYGKGDFEQTIRIAMQCGDDSDCNASNAGGIVGAMIGYKAIPAKFLKGFNTSLSYGESAHKAGDQYTWNKTNSRILDAARKIARLQKVVILNLGAANEKWVISKPQIIPLIKEQVPLNDTNNIRPVVTATGTAKNNFTVEFTAAATDNDGIKGFQWFFGDLTHSNVIATNGNVSHVYDTAGNYEAVCYATDGKDNTNYRILQIKVEPNGATSIINNGKQFTIRVKKTSSLINIQNNHNKSIKSNSKSFSFQGRRFSNQEKEKQVIGSQVIINN